MSKMYAILNNDNIVHYPTDMFKFFDKFPFVIRFDTKVIGTGNNADKIRSKLFKLYGFKDFIVYPLLTNNKKTNYWELRFKSELDQQVFVTQYPVKIKE